VEPTSAGPDSMVLVELGAMKPEPEPAPSWERNGEQAARVNNPGQGDPLQPRNRLQAVQKDVRSEAEGGLCWPRPVLPLVSATKGTIMISQQTGESKKTVMSALARAGRLLLEASLGWTGA